ncbi:MAG: hypothetical protein JXA10_01705 [Anaerolineae bacterium]|nr:hypothetical protein [Anaerolineae bacterium]
MLKRLFPNRITTLTIIVFALAFVICGMAWLRFFTVAATHPSPVRYMEFVTETGTHLHFQQECIGPAFIEIDAVWRYCEYEEQWGLVRFDLAAGEALMQWPLPEAPDAQILALAPSPTSDDFVIAWGSPDLSAIYHIKRAGGVVSLGVPPDVTTITGLMWLEADAGGGVELLTPQESTTATASEQDQYTIFTHDLAAESASEWLAARTFTHPVCGWDGYTCVFQLARYTERGWGFISAAIPTQIDDPAAVQVDFNQIDETMRGLRIGSVDLVDLDPGQYTISDSGALLRLDTLFDQAPANRINWAMDAAPLTFPNDFARIFESPSPDASFYFSNYAIMDDHLRWIPGLRYPAFSWYMDEWVTLQTGEDGVVLAHYTDPAHTEAGDTLTTDAAFIKQSAQTCVLPASDGGYWILGPNGAYLKADEVMSRADSLNVIERVQRSFENFGTLEAVQDDAFYREQRALKMAAFPLILLSLPVGYLLVAVVRQTRPKTRTWITLLLQVSAIYVILAAIFFWWFWEMTDHF